MKRTTPNWFLIGYLTIAGIIIVLVAFKALAATTPGNEGRAPIPQNSNPLAAPSATYFFTPSPPQRATTAVAFAAQPATQLGTVETAPPTLPPLTSYSLLTNWSALYGGHFAQLGTGTVTNWLVDDFLGGLLINRAWIYGTTNPPMYNAANLSRDTTNVYCNPPGFFIFGSDLDAYAARLAAWLTPQPVNAATNAP